MKPEIFRSSPVSDQTADTAGGPFCAKGGSERTYSITLSA